MRCSCCNKNLSDYEATLRIVSTNSFADTCLKCLQGLQIEVKGNTMLKKKIDLYEEEELLDELDDGTGLEDICIDYRRYELPGETE
jgi:hypothetical protein